MAHQVNLPEGMANARIPKLLHQTWKEAKVPAKLEACQKTWQQNHPSWEYTLWTDEDLRNLIEQEFSWFLPYYDAYPHNIQRVDAARYFIMYHFGGVYADLDMQSLTPLDPLLVKFGGVVVGQEGQPHHDNSQRIGNALLISSRHHPFWLKVFAGLMAEASKSDQHKLSTTFVTTGPSFLHEVYQKHPAGVTVMPAATFYPMPWKKPDEPLKLASQRQYPKAFAVHHWAGTWRKEPAKYRVTLPTEAQEQVTLVCPRKKKQGWGIIEETIRQGQLYRPQLVATWAGFLRPGDTVIHAGAYTGALTICLAHLVSPTGHVHAFEPDQWARELLLEAVRANRLSENVDVYDCMPASRQMLLYQTRKRNPLRPHRLVWRSTRSGIAATQGQPLNGLQLDALTLLHLDCNGEEYGAIEGALALIRRFRPVITLEMWADQKRTQYGTSIRRDQVMSLLEREGYSLQPLEHSYYVAVHRGG